MADDLTELARQYVSLTAQLQEVRNAIKRCVLNGVDPEPPPGPTSARSKPGQTAKPMKPRPPGRDEVMAQAKLDDDAVIAALKNEPMRLVQLAEATGQKQTTLSNRLKRLAERGLIERSGGGWAAAPSP
jgi:predicted Rossmann fold nucleotide-binding protein DprA/Smf involved in DNA uptake